MTGYIETAPHEFDAYLLYPEHDLSPWFACDAQVKGGDGSVAGSFERDGERWVCKLSYQESNIVDPGDRLPTGTEFRIQTIREYRLKVARHTDEDDVGEQTFVAHITPRWDGMEGEKDDGSTVEIPVPEDVDEAVNVRVQGANIEFDRYRGLLRAAADAVGIRGYYFGSIHPTGSRILDAERYVRLHRDTSGPVHARDGPIAQLGHLLEHDRRGYRKVVQNDDDNHGRNLPGFYHTVTLDPRRVREAFPDHALPKEIKHYYAKEAYDRDSDDPLAHPKLGTSYQRNLWREEIRPTGDGLEQLSHELHQTVLSVLADAGLQLHPGEHTDPYVADAYFAVEETTRDEEPVALDLARIEHDQESIVVRELADGLSPVEWDSLQVLVTDGGEVSPSDIADATGRHVDSVRRALSRIDELVEREYGQVNLRSTYVAELVHEAVKEAKDATRRAVEAGAKAMHAAERGLDEKTSAFLAWAAANDVDVDDRRDARLTLRFGDVDDLAHAIQHGFRLWKDAGQDPTRYRQAQVEANGGYTTVWRWL